MLKSCWKAIIGSGDHDVAAQSLSQAETILGSADDLPNERAFVERLRLLRAIDAVDQAMQRTPST
jgi:hypothetical protein